MREGEGVTIRKRFLDMLIKRASIRRLFELPEDRLYKVLQRRYREYDLPKYMYREFEVESEKNEKGRLFIIRSRNTKPERGVLFLHGGGGMMSPTLFHFRLAARLARESGAELWFPFYPLAPEYTSADSYEYAENVYHRIKQKFGAENLIMAGDSAGAGMTIGLCAADADKPRGLILISPPAGMKNKERLLDIESRDLMLSLRSIDIIKRSWTRGDKKSDAYTDALNADVAGFPPVLMYYGTEEMFCPGLREFAQKLRENDIQLETHEGNGMCHDWAIAGVIPAGREAARRMAEFIKEV